MDALLYLALAMIAGLLLTRFSKLIRLPNVTGFLIAGLLIGPSVLGLLNEQALSGISFLSSVALGFIAFSIGDEFKLNHLKQIGSKAVIIAFIQAFAAVALVDVALILFKFELPLALTLGAIAAATAPAATLMVVRQYKAKGEVTDVLLPVVAIDDAFGLMFFSVSLAVAQALAANQAIGVATMILNPLKEILLSLLIGMALGLLVAFAMRFFHSSSNRLSLCIAAVFAGIYAAERFGLSDLLLCMAIGATIVNLRNDLDKTFVKIESWTEPLFMLFFVLSGAELDLSVLPKVGLLGAVYIIVRAVGKYSGAFLGGEITGASSNVKKYLGITLLPQAGVAIGMAYISVNSLPAYGSTILAVVLSATLVYELIGPVMTKIALTKAGEIKTENNA